MITAVGRAGSISLFVVLFPWLLARDGLLWPVVGHLVAAAALYIGYRCVLIRVADSAYDAVCEQWVPWINQLEEIQGASGSRLEGLLTDAGYSLPDADDGSDRRAAASTRARRNEVERLQRVCDRTRKEGEAFVQQCADALYRQRHAADIGAAYAALVYLVNPRMIGIVACGAAAVVVAVMIADSCRRAR